MARTNWIDTAIPKEKIPAIFLRLTPSSAGPEGDLVLGPDDIPFDEHTGPAGDNDCDDDGDANPASQENMPGSDPAQAVIIALYPDGSYPKDKPQRYFSAESIKKILALFPRVKCLLTDAPSMDRACNGGILASHEAFWAGRQDRTITELCHLQSLPFASGTRGMLQIQVLPIYDGADAVPTRPLFHCK